MMGERNNGGHTPGPWRLETVKTSCGICHKIGPFPNVYGKESHACVYVDNTGPGPLFDEFLANARLIASAPDLLEALERSLQYVILAQVVYLERAETKLAEFANKDIYFISAAISKAREGSNDG